MQRLMIVLAVLGCCQVAPAAVSEGENLLINGVFATEQADLPDFWSATPRANVRCEAAGGPGGRLAAIVLHSDGSVPTAISVRQQGLNLVAGETYKLSAWVKTKGFSSRHYGVIVHNSGWVNEAGLKGFAADSDWTQVERTFTLMESKDGEYGVALFAVALSGELQVADVRLEAISEGARQGSTSQLTLIAAPRLVPMRPLLNQIPVARPELVLRAFGQLPGEPADLECLVTVASGRLPAQTVPLNRTEMVANLAGLPLGDDRLTAVLRHRQTQATVAEASYPITLIDPPAIRRDGIQQLNNLVADLLVQPLPATTARFVNPRDGWVFVAVETAAPAADLAVAIGAEPPLITAATARLEAFRELPAGEHEVRVTGQTAGRLIVRSIPEIFNYPPCVNSYVPENGAYDWAFMQRHILPAVTTLNGGALPGPALGEAKAMGLKWLANFNVAPMDDAAELQRRLEAHAGLTKPEYDGLTSDELFFSRTSIDTYTKALWTANNPEHRLIYTWVVGKPSIPALHTDFIAACLNTSRGRGRLLYEAYCHPQADEATAAGYLNGHVTETMRQLKAYYPGVEAGTGIIFGNFTQLPIISLDHNPAVDFKYYLDMQVNLIANHPEFAGLATTGYWGTYYGDEELVRWSFLLMRHYAVEGRRDMLSARYGFRYNPGFVTNPDFATGLTGWELAPAAEGSIEAATIPGYGRSIQGRWTSGVGDQVCVMTRQAGAANRVMQTAQGLEVGRLYCLQFVTADRQDILQKRHNPRQLGLAVSLPGAEILPERGYLHIDRRQTHRRHAPEHLGKINLHRIIFRATSSEQQLVFSDEAAAPNDELVLNFVQLKPYLD